MGTLLYPSETLAKQELDKWWKTHSTITTKEFRERLMYTHPDYDWSFIWCSKYLYQNTNSVEINGINYYSLTNPKKKNFELAIDLLDKLGVYITKKNIKITLQYLSVESTGSEFEQVFKQLNLKETGNYTSENHKIYTL